MSLIPEYPKGFPTKVSQLIAWKYNEVYFGVYFQTPTVPLSLTECRDTAQFIDLFDEFAKYHYYKSFDETYQQSLQNDLEMWPQQLTTLIVDYFWVKYPSKPIKNDLIYQWIPTIHPLWCLFNADKFPAFEKDVLKNIPSLNVMIQSGTISTFDNTSTALYIDFAENKENDVCYLQITSVNYILFLPTRHRVSTLS